jgi:hypothetical protein
MKTKVNPEKRYVIPHMVVMLGDVEEQLPDVTDTEMETIATALSNAMLYSFHEVLSDVLTLIKEDRKIRV